ncbi:MAG: DUF4179 domain-containing protein [Clostridia bacterium]|nr:DUF4179 domain-containing protein [Clostridia bacterium]
MNTEKQINLKEHMDTKMEDIRVNKTMKQNIMAQIESEQNHETIRKSSGKWNRKKLILMAAAAVLIAAYPVTAGAQAAYHVVSGWVTAAVSGEVAQNIYPVNDSATDQGIQVEVESAVNDNHNALVFITVQDTEGKGRLGEDIDLCDSFDLDIGGVKGHVVATAVMDSYDPVTQTARFYTYQTIHGDIADKPVTAHLTGIMAHKTKIPNCDTGIDLAAIVQQHPKVGGSAIKDINGVGYTNIEEPARPKKSDVLTPDVMDVPLGNGLDFVHISNIGYIDGRLHIQTRWDASFDNHGDLRLCRKDYTGDYTGDAFWDYVAPVSGIDTIYFDTAEDIANNSFYSHTKHIEYLFDVSPEDLRNYNLIATDMVKDGILTKGDWQVSFRTQHTESLLLDGGRQTKSVEITPLGVYVEGYTGKDTPVVVITYADGSTETVDCFGMTSVSGIFTRRRSCYAEILLDKSLSEIVCVTIDGEEIHNRT